MREKMYIMEGIFGETFCGSVHLERGWCILPSGSGGVLRDRENKAPTAVAWSGLWGRLSHLAQLILQLLDDALFQPGYVALGDAHHVGDLLLGVLRLVVEAEAQLHDAALPG